MSSNRADVVNSSATPSGLAVSRPRIPSRKVPVLTFTTADDDGGYKYGPIQELDAAGSVRNADAYSQLGTVEQLLRYKYKLDQTKPGSGNFVRDDSLLGGSVVAASSKIKRRTKRAAAGLGEEADADVPKRSELGSAELLRAGPHALDVTNDSEDDEEEYE